MFVQQVILQLSHFLPETVLASTFCIAIVAGLIFRNHPRVIGWIAVAGVAASLVLVLRQAGLSEEIFTGMIAVDPFAVFFKSLAAVCSLIIFLFSIYSSEVQTTLKRMAEYYALLIAMTLGMFLMAGATNLLMMVLAMELVSLSSYLLAGYTKEAPDSSEASLKYIIYGAVSSGVMLYGISILFGLTGAMNYAGINHALAVSAPNSTALLLAVIFITVGFGFKISAVPFHFWTPDVYEGAPITITAFLSVASKAAGFAMMMRFFKIIFIDTSVLALPSGMWVSLYHFEWNKILVILSVLTMTLGNLVAVWQDNLKRLLAYSSIAHAGYMLMGVVLLSDKGIAAVLIYFVMYLFMNLGAFYVVMLVANKTGSEDISAYRGLGRRSPIIGVSMALFLISLTGLPPSAGFIGKFYLFVAVLDARWIWLAVIGAVNSVISLYYYARVLRYMFLREADAQLGELKIFRAEALILLALAIPTLLFGLYFAPIVDIANASVHMVGLH
ncbi:MAG: NADH-quinone oxidoreductase subunit N [Ignavibacteriae bacterium]|nr:MAG: NADH-quinone oxidoreductase subunit N [Ignavibacteriota bacterium]